jgi:hypothetical protein
MTGPGVSDERRLLARCGTTVVQPQPATASCCGAGAPDNRPEGALATHRPCPIDGCPGPARAPAESITGGPAMREAALDALVTGWPDDRIPHG